MGIHATAVLDDLWRAMGLLYDARYKSTGEVMGKQVEPFDYDTFSEIAGLQNDLQRLLTRLEDKAKKEKSDVATSDPDSGK